MSRGSGSATPASTRSSGALRETTRLANATPERLRELLAANLDTLDAILRWNDANDIRVFRVSSNTVPLASHPRARFLWREELGERFAELGILMRGAGMRLSMHPGPYTVLASADEAIADAAVRELDYHAELMSAFGLDRSHKIVLHLGGGAGDRESWLDRFGRAFGRLTLETRSRLVPENDERWSFADILPVAGELIPSRGERVSSQPRSARDRRARGRDLAGS